MTAEARFYAAELRALLACTSEDDARPNLTCIGFAVDGQRCWATNGHVLLMRYQIAADPWAETETITIDRSSIGAAAAVADVLDAAYPCGECGEPVARQEEYVTVALGEPPSIRVGPHTLSAALASGKTPPAWAVLPKPDEIGQAKGRVVSGRYLAQLGVISDGVEARFGERSCEWCIGFSGVATLPGGKKQSDPTWGPMVARLERDGYGWIYVVMPLKPYTPFSEKWHREINGHAESEDGDA
jgi:hypothetical protein